MKSLEDFWFTRANRWLRRAKERCIDHGKAPRHIKRMLGIDEPVAPTRSTKLKRLPKVTAVLSQSDASVVAGQMTNWQRTQYSRALAGASLGKRQDVGFARKFLGLNRDQQRSIT